MAAIPTPGSGPQARSALEVPAGLTRALRAVRTTLSRWIDNYEARRYLERLDDHMLCDLGLDPREVRREVLQPFWAPYTLTQRRD